MEMSSVNPLLVLPEALHTRAAQIAAGLFGSFTLGVGQFCTKPGLVYLPRKAKPTRSSPRSRRSLRRPPLAPMLTEGISKSYHSASPTARRTAT